MYKLGITGGIGSGKSTAARFFKKKDTRVFDADEKAKTHLRKTVALQHRLIHTFGYQITTDNHLDFKKLSEIAFSSQKEQKILNGIVWPEVYILLTNAANQAEKEGIKLFTSAKL